MTRTPETSATFPSLGGVILAGGASRRMGRDKARLPLHGSSMLFRVVVAVQQGLSQMSGGAMVPLVVAAAPEQDLPSLPDGVLRVRDSTQGQGPLRGLETGLTALAGESQVVYVASCDTPLLKPAFVERVVSLLGSAHAAVPVIAGRYHPLAGVYRSSLLPRVRDLLNAGQRRPLSLLQAVRTRMLHEEDLRPADPQLQSLLNINTPDDYEAVQKILARGDP